MTKDNSIRRRLLCLLGLAPAAVLTSAAIKASPADKPNSADQALAEKSLAKFQSTIKEGFRTQNAELLTSPEIYFTNDSSADHYVLFDVMPPFSDIGAKKLLEKNREYAKATSGPTTVDWSDGRVRACGAYAFFHGVMQAKGKYNDGRTFDTKLRHTVVFKRVGDNYLVMHEHASLPNEAIGIETPKAKA